MGWHFEEAFVVRDYECDLQGIVNNAVYQNYLEHTRNLFLKKYAPSLMELHKRGIDAVVSRIEIDYKWPLKPDDHFVCRLRLERDGELKLVFKQELIINGSEKPCTKAKVVVVFLVNGKLGMPQEILKAFSKFL